MNFTDYKHLAEKLIDDNRKRDELFAEITDCYNCRWEFPEGMPSWMHKVVSTDPRDAVVTATRVLSTGKFKPKVFPLIQDEPNRKRANEVEKALAWNFAQSRRRNPSGVIWDVVHSAVTYAEAATQVIYLPYQEQVLKTMKRDASRLKSLKRFGDFAFVVHYPGSVYTLWGDYGPEAVLVIRTQTADEFTRLWGGVADKIGDYKHGEDVNITTFDMMDYDKRIIWGAEGDGLSVDGKKMFEGKNELGFLPYVVKRFGNNLASDSSEKVLPLLQSVVQSGQWDMLNVIGSIDVSLSVKRAAAARYAGEFPQGQTPELDLTEPEGVIEIPPGTRNFQEMRGQSIDERLTFQYTNLRNLIWQATIAKSLQSLDFPSGTPFSAVNQVLQAATASLSPYKMLAEMTLAEMAHQMLCYVVEYGDKYGTADLYGYSGAKDDYGAEIRLPSDTISPDDTRIEVILQPDLPLDRQAQVNSAVLLNERLKVSRNEVLEDLGISDPDYSLEQWAEEMMKIAYVQNEVQAMQAQTQMQIQQQGQAAQMQMQQAAQQQQMQQMQQQQIQQQPMNPALSVGQPSVEQASGLENNPAAGGRPPIQGAPGMGLKNQPRG